MSSTRQSVPTISRLPYPGLLLLFLLLFKSSLSCCRSPVRSPSIRLADGMRYTLHVEGYRWTHSTLQVPHSSTAYRCRLSSKSHSPKGRQLQPSSTSRAWSLDVEQTEDDRRQYAGRHSHHCKVEKSYTITRSTAASLPTLPSPPFYSASLSSAVFFCLGVILRLKSICGTDWCIDEVDIMSTSVFQHWTSKWRASSVFAYNVKDVTTPDPPG